MEILNLGGAAEGNSSAPKSRKKLRVLLGIGALAAVTGIGSTLAANISLNGGGNVEFGQGVATTAACDNDITLTPISTFSNTEEDSIFAMTAIEVNHIDMTPEGWDSYRNEWISGFDRTDHSWSDNMKEHAGQYISTYENVDPAYQYSSGTPVWTNTCENKVLMLRAFTDNYPERTVENTIESPLYLTGLLGFRPRSAIGTNAGVGFRLTHNESNSDWYNFYNLNEINNDDGYGYQFNATNNDWDYDNISDTWVTIYLDANTYNYPPLDSRWVDKLTVESAATIPSNWVLE